jgi:hypothetical protein
MSAIKFNPNLFLETIELTRFKEFLDLESVDSATGFAHSGGFRKNILENSVSFGLIKNNRDITFQNGLVSQGSDLVSGSVTLKTVNINQLYAVDSQGQFIYQNLTQQLSIPSDNSWYWVRVSHQYSGQEKGTFSIDASGNLTGTGGEFTKILRGGQNNFSSKIVLLNSTLNTAEYEILSVTDDNNCILTGTSFQVETGLKLGIIGTFTPGVSVPSGNKLIFQYDGCLTYLSPEVTLNTPPTSGYSQDITFYIARVKSDGTTLSIQDKRLNHWDTKGSQLCTNIDRTANPLIGVEAVKYSNALSPGDKNTIEISWGLRSSNWSINTNTNTLTISGPIVGGKYRDITTVPSGIFNGWRVYTSNGLYSRIVSSSTSGSAINLVLDILNIDNYYTGGTANSVNIINQQLLVVPDSEEISIKLTPNAVDNILSETKVYNFPINTPFGKCEVLAYLSTCLYNIKYAYKNLKDYTGYNTIPSNNVTATPQVNGYYPENQFDGSNNLISSPVVSLYTASDTTGFIPVNLSPNAYSTFVKKVFKGDLIGVTKINSFDPTTNLYDLIVGTNLNYLELVGNITLTADTVIRLNSTGAINGNEFRIQFNCTSFNLGGYTLQIVGGTGLGTSVVKTITQGDLYMMKNIDGGIEFDCVYDGSLWNCYQNYDLGVPFETKFLTKINSLTSFNSSGLGNVKGLYGYSISDGRNGTDDLRHLFIVNYDSTDPEYAMVGNQGGSKKVVLTADEIPPLLTVAEFASGPGTTAQAYIEIASSASGKMGIGVNSTSPSNGHENRPPYYTALYIQKLY